MLHPLLLEVGPISVWPIVVTLVVAAVALYLLLPRPQPYPIRWGGSAAGVALLLTATLLISWGAFSVENFLFFCFAGGAVGFGALMLTQHDPARAALSFAMVVLSTCGLYLLQAAPFLMAATIIIYAGAIIVTFLFVLMLAQQHGLSSADYRSREGLLATVAGFVLLGSLLYVLKVNYDTRPLDELVKEVQQARAEDKTQEFFENKSAKFLEETRSALRRVRPDVAAEVSREIKTLLTVVGADEDPAKAPEKAEQHKILEKIEQVLVRVRLTTGDLQPRTIKPDGGPTPPALALSRFSGPAANNDLLPTRDSLRREDAPPPFPNRRDDGAAPLPAENVAALGRTLFTDYLLSVELGGTLLLVATVGAIAITGRRGGRTL